MNAVEVPNQAFGLMNSLSLKIYIFEIQILWEKPKRDKVLLHQINCGKSKNPENNHKIYVNQIRSFWLLLKEIQCCHIFSIFCFDLKKYNLMLVTIYPCIEVNSKLISVRQCGRQGL